MVDIFGPFTRAQLESLRDRGQLTRFHEVSQDRQTWTSAASVSELFSQGEATPSQSPSNAYSLAGREIPVHEAQQIPIVAASAPVDESPSWFYSRGGAHAGPVTFHDLQRMAARGEIGPDSLVWKSGMADWVVSRNFPDLVFPVQGAVTSVSAVPPQTYRTGRTGLFEHPHAQAVWRSPAWFWESSFFVESEVSSRPSSGPSPWARSLDRMAP